MIKKVVVGALAVGAVVGAGVLLTRWLRRRRMISAGMAPDADRPPPKPVTLAQPPTVTNPPPKPRTFMEYVATPVLRVRQGFGRRYN